MASVSSLDKDLSRLRLAKYTPQDSQDVKDWIGDILGEKLPAGDLMVVLKDGVILCKLANRLETSNPKLRFKSSSMPFVQMENISHFLSFVSRPPVSLAAHDVFLTVDLFEQKDPAQVVQCLGAFSRIANRLDPVSFPATLGGLKIPATTAALSPQLSGGWSPGKRNVSGGSTVSGVANAYVQSAAATGAPTPFGKPTIPPRKPAMSSWSKPTDEKGTAPAWNIAQYGYMGGASQGNQGVSFGSRRQITNQPVVKGPSLEDREKLRKNSADDAQRVQEIAQERRRADDEKRRFEEERRRKEGEQRRIEEERIRKVEEQKRIEEERRLKEEEKKRVEDDERRKAVFESKKRREQEEEKAALEVERRKEEDHRRLWQQEQDQQRELERVTEREQKLATDRREEEARRVRDVETQRKLDVEKSERERERERIRQLERELEKARERERIYEAEKEERRRQDTERMRRDAQEAVIRKHKTGDSSYGQRAGDRDSYLRSHKTGDRDRENMEAERRFLTGAWRGDIATPPSTTGSTPLFPQHTPGSPPVRSPRALPTPPPRKLPPPPTTPNRVGALPTSRYFAQEHLASEPMGRSGSWETNDDGAAVALERERAEKREADKKQAYKWASMSLLERERERERERQREWEANQREIEERRDKGDKGDVGDDGPAWDVNQYGYADDILDLY